MSRIDNFSLLKNLDHRRQWSPRSAKLLRKCLSHTAVPFGWRSHTPIFLTGLSFLAVGCACKRYLVIYPTSNPQVCRESSSYFFLSTAFEIPSKHPQTINAGEEKALLLTTMQPQHPTVGPTTKQRLQRRPPLSCKNRLIPIPFKVLSNSCETTRARKRFGGRSYRTE